MLKLCTSDNQHYEKVGDTVKCIEEEIPFEIPEGWAWCRLDSLSVYIQRGKSPEYSEIKKIPVIAQKCNHWSGFCIDKAKFIVPDTLSSYAEERILQDKDLLWNSTGLGTLGRMAIYKCSQNPYGIAVADSHVTVIRIYHQYVCADYVYLWIASPAVQLYIEDKAEGSTKQKELYINTIKQHLVPIPPLHEQRHIVQKCKNLLEKTKEYAFLEDCHTRMEEKLPSVLKKSLLQYAIQGKLVPQNPDDEPASVLLERIKAEKEQLIKDGKLKRDKNESYIYRGSDNSYYERIGTAERCIDAEIPFEIPKSWEWCRLGSTGFIVRGNGIKRNETTSSGVKCIRYGELYTTYNYIFQETISYVPQELADKCKHIKYGDALFTLTGENKQDIGKAIVYVSNEDAVIGGDLAQFTKHLFEPLFLAYLLNSPYVVFQKSTAATGDIIVHISGEKLANLLIALPPQIEQKRIAKKITEINTLLG